MAVSHEGSARQSPPRLGYRPPLDGLRAVAIGGVVAFHGGLLHAGDLGVTVFFALSGFLISTLLLEERATYGRVALRTFYLRRVYRLYPAVVVALLATLVVTLVHIPPVDDHMWVAYPAALFYFANYVPIAFVPHALGSIVWTWSLSVEEQFYVVWPTLCRLFLRRTPDDIRRGTLPGLRWLAAAAVALLVVSLVVRTVVFAKHPGDPHMYFDTVSRMDALLLGCLAAMWRQRQLRRDALLLRAPGIAAGVGLAVIGVVYAWTQDRILWQDPLVAAATALLLLGVTEDARCPVSRLLSWRPLVHIGKISYSIYLYNLLAMGLWGFLRHDRPTGWELVGWVAITLALAEASYHFVERPVLRRAPRADRRAPEPYPAPVRTPLGARVGVAAR